MKTPTMGNDRDTPVILMIDDDKADAELVRLTLEECGRAVRFEVVTDGASGLDYLRGTGPDRPLPDLVFLDVNMPGMTGFETLRAIRNDPALSTLPVVMFSTSTAEADVRRSYSEGASAYVSKPPTLDSLIETMDAVCGFWFDGATTPPQRR